MLIFPCNNIRCGVGTLLFLPFLNDRSLGLSSFIPTKKTSSSSSMNLLDLGPFLNQNYIYPDKNHLRLFLSNLWTTFS